MPASQFVESDFLAMVRERVTVAPAGTRLGIGDDAAVLAAPDRDVVVAADMILDGVDFRVTECGYRAAGEKAIKKNISDLAAMGVEPWCSTLSVAFPSGATRAEASELLDGILGATDRYRCPLVGGDTKRSSGPLVLSVQVLGLVADAAPVTRSGAQVGDVLLVTGALGGASRGHHLTFEPRLDTALRLNREYGAHAMIDLSDGLSTDLHRVCAASGVGARIDAASIPIATAARALAEVTGREPLSHALSDGEDYELLVAIDESRVSALLSDAEVRVPLTVIGRCVAAADGVIIRRDGRDQPLVAGGFEHRFSEEAGS